MKPAITRDDPQREYYFREGCYINELSNSEDDAGLSIARVRVITGDTTRWHCLVGTAERYVILKGAGEVAIGDLPPEAVSAGDVVLIPAGCRQRIRNIGDGDLRFLAFCTPRFVSASYCDFIQEKP